MPSRALTVWLRWSGGWSDGNWDESKRDLKNENYVPLRKVGLYLEN